MPGTAQTDSKVKPAEPGGILPAIPPTYDGSALKAAVQATPTTVGLEQLELRRGERPVHLRVEDGEGVGRHVPGAGAAARRRHRPPGRVQVQVVRPRSPAEGLASSSERRLIVIVLTDAATAGKCRTVVCTDVHTPDTCALLLSPGQAQVCVRGVNEPRSRFGSPAADQ